MKKNFKRAGVALALSGLGLIAVAQAGQPAYCEEKAVTQPQTSEQDPRAGMRREGRTVLEASDLSSIRSTLGDIMSTAVTKDLESAVGYFSKLDRDRLSDYASKNADVLKDRIAAFKENWKAKYNTDFRFDAEKSGAAVFNYQIVPGQSEKYARVTVPAGHSLPEVSLQLVNEGIITNAWRIDTPDSLSGEKLRDGLMNAIGNLNRDHTSWPADQEAAYRMVAHHVFAAMTGAAVSSRS